MNEKKTIPTSDLLVFILGSIEILLSYIEIRENESKIKEMLTIDALCYRVLSIGQACNWLSDSFVEKQNKIPFKLWRHLSEYNMILEEDIDYIVNGDSKYEGIADFFTQIEEIYLSEYQVSKPKKQKKIEEHRKNVEWSRDYKYPITTKNSIWTVKKR
jgi:uncharacterized protein with HEPN domain